MDEASLADLIATAEATLRNDDESRPPAKTDTDHPDRHVSTIDTWNARCHPFAWVKTANQILACVKQKAILAAVHWLARAVHVERFVGAADEGLERILIF